MVDALGGLQHDDQRSIAVEPVVELAERCRNIAERRPEPHDGTPADGRKAAIAHHRLCFAAIVDMRDDDPLSPAVQHCQNRAAECERLAALASDVEGRNNYLRLAESWRRLADNREFVMKMEAFLGYVRD